MIKKILPRRCRSRKIEHLKSTYRLGVFTGSRGLRCGMTIPLITEHHHPATRRSAKKYFAFLYPPCPQSLMLNPVFVTAFIFRLWAWQIAIASASAASTAGFSVSFNNRQTIN